MIDDHAARMDRALLALDGLSLGDSFGERFFGPPDIVADMLVHRRLPAGTWRYTDDSEMSLAIVDVLRRRGVVDRDDLAASIGWPCAVRSDRRMPAATLGTAALTPRSTRFPVVNI